MFLIPVEWLQITKYSIIESAIKTDHKAILCKLQGEKFIPKGPGLWKLNSQLVQEEAFKALVQEAVVAVEAENWQDAGLKWDRIKQVVREKAMKYGRERAQKGREKLNQLKTELRTLEQELYQLDPQVVEQYKETKQKIEQIYDEKAEGAMIRSRARWLQSGEKNTKYFFGLEKRNTANQCISRLQKSDETIEDIRGLVPVGEEIGAVDGFRARVALQEDPDKETTVPQRSRLLILISGGGEKYS